LDVAFQHGAFILPAPHLLGPIRCYLTIQACQLCPTASNHRMEWICSPTRGVAAHFAPAAMNDYCWLVPEAGDAVVLTVVIARSVTSKFETNMVSFDHHV
jgi:hypothetical protein